MLYSLELHFYCGAMPAVKFQSLADVLGTVPESTSDLVEVDVAKIDDIGAFCRAILDSHEYRQSISFRITLGTLPPAVELRFYDYAAGKPVERVEVKDSSERIEDLTPDVAIQKLERVERMLRLLRAAQEDEPVNASLTNASLTNVSPTSVH